MATRRWKPCHRRSKGFILIALLAMLTMGGLYFFISNLTPEAVEAKRQQKTSEALNAAREALLGYALQYRELQIPTGTLDAMYGRLPMPDVGTTQFHASQSCKLEGCAMDFINGAFPATTATIIGRFPWRTVGTAPIKDGHNECLWYIVSAHHKSLGIDTAIPMNADTLGDLDIVTANGTAALTSAITNAHNRPVVIIFSAGPPLPNQNRAAIGTNDVTECGGNYNPVNYLDPFTATALTGVTNYLAGASNTSLATSDGDLTNDPDDALRKAMMIQGKIYKSGTNFFPGGCAGGACELLANDIGTAITPDDLFGAIRKNNNFRTDINSMLDRMAITLQDDFAGGATFTPVTITGITSPGDKTAGRIPTNTKYDDTVDPKGYFSNYRSLVFAAKTTAGSFSVNGQSCTGVLLFANQRSNAQRRITDGSGGEKNTPGNYLEGDNLTSFTNTGITFAGAEKLERVSATQTVSQDIVRCIPSGPSETQVIGNATYPLANFQPSTGVLTLGQPVSSTIPAASANSLFACSWQAAHPMGGGLRSYFTFRIEEPVNFSAAAAEGIAFAIVDSDTNTTSACGAAGQHMGYSGNNTVTPFVAAPKIGFEIDPRREANFSPTATSTLTNGRNDPATGGTAYRGGHVAITYWGGETSILATGAATGTVPPCTAPRFAVGASNCYLPQEEDDNVHGQPAYTRTGFPVPPPNPDQPKNPDGTFVSPPKTDCPAGELCGIFKLDPRRSQVPVERDFHVRIELTRNSAAFSLPTVRAASTANINLTIPGATIDGYYPATGDRILIKDQSSPAENGIYIWNGSSIPMARATDADTTAKLAGYVVEVDYGAQNKRSIWRQSVTVEASPVSNTSALWSNIRVKVATTANVSLASPGSSIDGILTTTGDRVLVKSQTTTSENGVYTWNGSAVAMTRTTDTDTLVKRTGSAFQIMQGAESGAWWHSSDGTAWGRLSVRVATQAPLILVNPGITAIDGVTMANGDRVLVKNQNDPAENGIYQWNGTATAMTRTTDTSSAAALAGALTRVQLGTNDTGRSFRQTTLATTGTLNTDSVRWVAIDPSPKYKIEVWILPDPIDPADPDTPRIVAMKNTTRPMSQLYSSFMPHLRDNPTIPYPFRNARIGFTVGQRTSVTDQYFTRTNPVTTWLD